MRHFGSGTSTALVAVAHDPFARMVEPLRTSSKQLQNYAGVYVRATPSTDCRTIEGLRAAGAVIGVASPNVGVSRRNVVRDAVAVGHPSIVYCDFDRWLHWAETFPGELEGLPHSLEREHPNAWLVCLGRT